MFAPPSPTLNKHCFLPQNVNAGEECGKVEPHDESHGGESVEILAVRQNYARAGDYDVGDEEGRISPVVVRDPAVDETACCQSVHTQGRMVAKVAKIGTHIFNSDGCLNLV